MYLYYVTHPFNKEKLSFLLSFHMISKPWKTRGQGFSTVPTPATHLVVVSHSDHPTFIFGILYCHQVTSATEKIFQRTFPTTLFPNGDPTIRVALARSIHWRKHLRQQLHHAPTRTIFLIGIVPHAPTTGLLLLARQVSISTSIHLSSCFETYSCPFSQFLCLVGTFLQDFLMFPKNQSLLQPLPIP